MRNYDKQEQLMKVNKESIIYKIKMFFKTFSSKQNKNDNNLDDKKIVLQKESSFKKEIKKIEDKETKLLKLQQQYKNGEIEEKDLTEEQIIELSKLYHRQIRDLRKSNKIRKQKILEYRKKM